MGKLANAVANAGRQVWLTAVRLWLASLLVTPFHVAADGAALHVMADGHLYHVVLDTAKTTFVAKLNIEVESMTTLTGSLYAASSGDLPALYRVTGDGMTEW